MHNQSKTYQELIEENALLNQRIREQEQSEIKYKKMGEVLKDSGEVVSLVMDEVSDLHAYVDAELRFVYINKAYADWYGLGKADIIGKHVEDILDEKVFKRALPHYQMALSGNPVKFENKTIDKEGQERFVSVRIVPHRSGKLVKGFFSSIIDITERKQAEEALQESERHMKLALEGTDQGLWEWDILSRKVVYDENWPRIMNLPSEERCVDMDQWLASMDAEGQAAFEINMTDYLAGRVRYYEIEHRLLTENKEWKWIWTRGIATERDPSGIPLRMIGTYRDITKQKQAEKAWKESEEHFRALAEYLPETVFETDMQGKLTFVNRNAFNCFRYTPQDFAIGINIHNLIHPDDRGRAMENIQRIMRGEDIGLNEYKLLRKDGSVFPTISHSSAILSNNEPVGLRGFIIDMTEHKRAEKALRESERKYRLLADRMTDIVWISDLNYNTTYLSPSIEFILGVSPEERIGSPFKDQVTPETYTRVMERLAIEMAKEESAQSDPDRTVTMEMEYYHRNGSIVWMENIVSAIRNDDGQLIGLQGVARDITSRKQADEIVQTSEEKFSKAFHSSPILTAISTMEDGRFLDVNEIFLQTLLFSREEIIGKTSLELGFFANPAQRQAIRTITEEKGYAKNIETQMVDKNGQIIDGLFSAEPITINNKKCWLTVMVDVTEQKRAEEKLRESELKYRSLFETSTQGILIYDRDGIIQMVNPSLMNLLGAKFPEEIVGRPYLDFVHPDDREISAARVKKILEDAFETPNKINIGQVVLPIREHRIIKTNGDVVNVESTGVALQYHGSTHIQGIFRDISERKRAEDALIEQLKFLQVLIDTIPIPVFNKDTNGIYLGCNRACETFFGPRDKLIGKTVYDVSPKDIADVYYRADLELFNNPGVQIYETLAADQAGARHNVIFNKATYQDKNGNLAGLIGTIFDITDRKQAEEYRRNMEERLQRAEKMEALGTLAGGVAHDLNNVLGIVVGYAEMTLDEVDKTSPLRPGLVNIMNGGQRAAAIVDDLLTLARRGVTGRSILNLNKILADCQKTPEFENLSFHHSSIKIKTDIDPDLLNISGSSVHLLKSLYNLVSNACEAMTKGGVVTIKTTNQYLDKPIHGYDQIREGDYVVLSVSDTGEGIHEADLKRIFEPFYTKKVMGRSGTGLGLAVVWGTAKDHNGYINVQSEEGKGSTFTLYFPVTREDISAEAVVVAISEYMGKGETILVVDDVKEQRDLAAGMLGTLNYTVSSVSSGEDAVAYMKEHEVDLIVLDMIMDPGMDGLDTYIGVLEIRPKQKAIIVSGFSESDRVRAAQGLGAGAYVRKPYIKENLGLAVRKELDRK